MGAKICKNCISYHTTTVGMFDRIIHYCSRFTTKDYDVYGNDTMTYYEVSENDSCDNFIEETTPENSNFRKGPSQDESSFCFLTSACVSYLGKTDDCEELEKLRTFRDNYMKKTNEGRLLVEEYYRIAPKIVSAIDSSPNRELYYNYILSVVKECITLIDEGQMVETQNHYVEMVRKLQSELLLTT